MKRTVLTVIGTLALASQSVLAHHGYAGFFDPKERTVAVEGRLENLVYGNPHVVMSIRTDDGTLHSVIWQSARWVERLAGVTPSTFKVGDRLSVVGAPSRDPAIQDITRVCEVLRPADGWHWRSMVSFAPPGAK